MGPGAAALRTGQPAALLCMVRSEDSSPNCQGFKMAVTATADSIGGGIMERKWVELARQRLLAGDAAPLLRPQVHRLGAPAGRSGMMCSGEQEVLLWPFSPAGLQDVAATALGALGSRAFKLSETGGLRVLAGAPAAFYDCRPGPQWRYCEQLGFHDQLTIVGGGYVSRALVRAAGALDFEITVLDNRPNLPMLAANDDAHHRHVLGSYEALAATVPPGPRRYVVVRPWATASAPWPCASY